MDEGTATPDASTAATTEDVMDTLQKQAKQANLYYESLAKQLNKAISAEYAEKATIIQDGNNMAEVMTPSMIMGAGNDGFLGGGGGLVGGLLLGSLLRNGNLLGGAGDTAMLRSPPEQSQANMSLMQAIGAVDKSVALGTATTETSNAVQTGALSAAVAGSTAASMSAIQSLKDVVNSNAMVLLQGQNAIQQNVMENRYELSKDIGTDGDKTRALITAQYEATLNRQLGEANAAIIELRSREFAGNAARGVEVTTTNNINQMQQQQQQQAQYGQLANLIWTLGQSIKDNNSAINVGSGVQTSTNTPTNTNIR